MPGNDIEYKVGAKFTGDSELKRAAAGVDALSRGVASGTGVVAGARNAWGNLALGLGVAGAAFWAAEKAAGQVYATLKQGAQLQTTIERFDKLAASIGTTADVMLGKLREATRGMIDDATLMASASQIVSLGLATNEEQVVRLATVVGTLGWDMQQVILTFANLSTMRLDALGLSVDSVKSKAKELEAQGYSAADAFKEAVIQAGEAKLDVGGVSEAEQSFKQAEAAVANFKNAILESAIATLDQAGAFDALSASAQALTFSSQFRAEIAAMREEGKLTWGQWFELINMLGAHDQAAASAALNQYKLAEAQVATGAATRGASSEWVSWAQQVAMAKQLSATEFAEWLALMAEGTGMTIAGLNRQETGFIQWSNTIVEAASQADRALANAGNAWASRNNEGWAGDRQARRDANLAFVRHDPDFTSAGALTRATMAYDTATSAARSYGGAVGYVSEQEQEAAAARQRFVAAFNQELLGKPEDGLIGAEGTVNVEAMNRALYEQVQVAGASAATLALLGVATGQFSEEQAEAALKAAILQEQINSIADAVVGGKITLEQALAQLSTAQASLNQADLINVAEGLADVPAEERTVNVEADVAAAEKDIGAVQSSLSVLTEEPYLTTLDADIAALLSGTDAAKRAIESVPSAFTVTVNWAQIGGDLFAALRQLGVI